eukprot:TRINITY_DN102193_c0_g1_i1.p1 TRINITY_DN102193_c0_g1~~TRINITY_DN102193_c0_g1_i1.p1  ORF type:complete len:624 (-),score=69.77 TRINITY_DN102193_c0_g1_i1:622-2493(-)
MAMRVLVTGPPGTGKTTLCSKVASKLFGSSCLLSGFLCHEQRDARGRRVGFELQTLDGSASAPLASVEGPPTDHTVGRYYVQVEDMEAFTLPILDSILDTGATRGKTRIFVFDEIGKMELFSARFVARMRQLLQSSDPALHVLGTVALKGGGFIAESKRITGVEVIDIDVDSRDAKAQELCTRFSAVATSEPRFERQQQASNASNSGTVSTGRRWQVKKPQSESGTMHADKPQPTDSEGAIVVAFGKGKYSQLGQNHCCEGSGDIQPIHLTAALVSAASLGFDHTGIVADGQLLLFGKNTCGQCAQQSSGQRDDKAPANMKEDVGSPKIALGLPGGVAVASVSCGGAHTLALLEDGSAWACGDHSSGQCGHGPGAPKFTTTFRRISSLDTVSSVSCGFKHSAAISDGAMYVWGACNQGQLGLGGRHDMPLPSRVDVGSPVCQVSLGRWHSLALTADSKVWTFGWGRFGVLGQGDFADHRSPVLIDKFAGQVKVHSISAGAVHNGAVVGENRHLFVWGRGSLGRLGLGKEANALWPTAHPTLDHVECIAMGGDFGVALSKGTWLVWGKNEEGQLGLGDSDRENRLLPTENPRLQGFGQVLAGDCHTLALHASSSLRNASMAVTA